MVPKARIVMTCKYRNPNSDDDNMFVGGGGVGGGGRSGGCVLCQIKKVMEGD